MSSNRVYTSRRARQHAKHENTAAAQPVSPVTMRYNSRKLITDRWTPRSPITSSSGSMPPSESSVTNQLVANKSAVTPHASKCANNSGRCHMSKRFSWKNLPSGRMRNKTKRSKKHNQSQKKNKKAAMECTLYIIYGYNYDLSADIIGRVWRRQH